MVGLPTFSIDRGFENSPVTSSSTQGVRSADCVSRLEVHAVQPPLKSIRLLKLLSSTDITNRNTTSTDVTPKYSAEDFPYVHYPEYIALSYVWGEENLTSTICVNGENVQVRTNLFQALSTIKESDPDAYLWADAICINQRDDKEKSNLVQHMGEIFANAKLVYAWLGPNVDALFARFAQPPQQGGFPTEEYSKFSQRPYWSRIWVLQEVYYAKELHYICGNSRLPSAKLQGALILLETFQRYLLGSHGPVYEQLESNDLLEKFTFGCPSFPEMHRLIIYTSIYPRDVITLRIAMTNFCVKELPRGSRATNPKDMIYGLMGFANNKEKSYIRADYSKSVEESYTITTRSMIRNGFTDILAWAQPETKRMAHLPSWVPDYTSTIYESLCSQGQAKAWLPQFRACGETRHHDENSQPFDDHVLSVHGRRLGEVLSVGQLWFPRWSGGVLSSSAVAAEAPSTRSASYDELLSFLSEIRDLALHAEQIYDRSAATGQSDSRKAPPFTNAIWRVPCCDQIVINSRLVRRCPSTQSLYAATINALHACVRDSRKDLPPESRPYVEALLRWVNKRPLLTANGFVGLGPASVEPGDTVAVLDGFNACYVLRSQQPPELNQYQLVGEAYVDGAMDGEMTCSVPDTGEWFHLV
ncbi:HET-domain-containing protein [Xylariaceae sp. AK1471]|nr:HET-domain-containing protein [Xylariaceae sp. AK1471]